jgi:hypothetical protein
LRIVLKELCRLKETSLVLEEATSAGIHLTKEDPQRFRLLENHFPSACTVQVPKALPVRKRSIVPEALFAGQLFGLRML